MDCKYHYNHKYRLLIRKVDNEDYIDQYNLDRIHILMKDYLQQYMKSNHNQKDGQSNQDTSLHDCIAMFRFVVSSHQDLDYMFASCVVQNYLHY